MSQIGRPTKVITIEPVENPVPAETPPTPSPVPDKTPA